MRSGAATPEDYLRELDPDRAAVIGHVRDLLNGAMPPGYLEEVAWGMIAWSVPLARYSETYNGQPLNYVALAARKDGYSLYLNCVYSSAERTERLQAAAAAAGKSLDMGKSCIRFKRVEDLPQAAIAAEVASATPDDYIAIYEAARSASRS